MANLAKTTEDAQDGVVTFEYNGKDYSIDRDFDDDVLLALEADKLATAVVHLLGDKQYKTFKESFLPGKPKVSNIAGLLTTATKAAGTTPGESDS